MKLTEMILIFSGVLLNAGAQLLLKAGAKSISIFAFTWDNITIIGWRLLTHPCIILGLCCYAISVVLWIMALSRVAVSVAYPMLSLGYLINFFAAWWLFGEAITLARMIGIVFIIIGVILIAGG